MNAPRPTPPESEPENLAPPLQTEDAASVEDSDAPEWIDVSPDAPHNTPLNPLGSVALEEAEPRARWHKRWNGFLVALAFVAALAVLRWVTWRQAVMYDPPLDVSALLTPAPPDSAAAATASPPQSATPKRVTIYVVGLVKKPGVFEMPAGSRLNDALRQAGGALPGADLEAVNLAEPLQDGHKYQFAARPDASGQATPKVSHAREAADSPPGRAQVLVAPRPTRSATSATPGARRASSKAPSAPIDLNRANVDELQQLPGVGPATAQSIVQYRDEIGGFKSVDDLDGVKGIGPKKLEKIRPYVLVQ